MVTFELPRGNAIRSEDPDDVTVEAKFSTTGANGGYFIVRIDKPDDVIEIEYDLHTLEHEAGPTGPNKKQIDRAKGVILELHHADKLSTVAYETWQESLEDMK